MSDKYRCLIGGADLRADSAEDMMAQIDFLFDHPELMFPGQNLDDVYLEDDDEDEDEDE